MTSTRFCLLPALLGGLLAFLLLEVRLFTPDEPVCLELRVTSEKAGRARAYAEHEERSAQRSGRPFQSVAEAVVAPGTQTLRLPFAEVSIHALKVWPLDRVGKVTVESAVILGPEGKEIGRVPSMLGEIETGPGKGKEIFFDPKITPPSRFQPLTWRTVVNIGMGASAGVLLWALVACWPAGARARLTALGASLRRGGERLPQATLLLAAVLATTLSCWPVIFSGRSFVSPGSGAPLLYGYAPTLPGAPVPPRGSHQGVEPQAVMWGAVPWTIAAHDAIFRDHEWPLWNRYDHCGTPLLGQGTTMLGDPLHWLPLAQRSAPWAWDLKYLLAKTAFALGIGLCVRAATGRLWVAALLTVSSSFLGAFSYEFNRPAFFALGYAPWILHAWLRASQPEGRVWPWVMAVALANYWQFSAGAPEESVMLMASLNFTGVLLVLASSSKGLGRRLAAMLWGLVLAGLLAAPLWLTYADALRQASASREPWFRYQMPPWLVLGFFDDLCHLPFSASWAQPNPSVNFLILLGCVWALVHLRTLLANRVFAALAMGAVLPAFLAFGILPAEALEGVPWFGKIERLDAVGSLALIVQTIPLAGFGLKMLWEGARTNRMAMDSLLAALLLAALWGLYYGTAQGVPWTSLLRAQLQVWNDSVFFFPLFWVMIAGALPWLVRAHRREPALGVLLLGAVSLGLLHFRQGMWTETQFTAVAMNPQARTDLLARSEGLEFIRERIAESGQPSRIAGYQNALAPGFQAVHGLEHFSGMEPVVSRWQMELMRRMPHESKYGWPGQLGTEESSPELLGLCDLFGLRWIVGLPADAPDGQLLGDLSGMENPNAWPRAFYTDKLLECSSLENFLSLLPGGKPLAATTESSHPPATVEEVGRTEMRAASDYRITSNTAEFKVQAARPGIAVFSQTYEPNNWRVTLNGRPVEYFRVNHSFLGVKLEVAGPHTLRFEYWPPAFALSLWLAAAGAVLWLLTPLIVKQPRERAAAFTPPAAA